MFSLVHNSRRYSFDAAKPIPIGVELKFNTPHAKVFGVELAAAQTYRSGEFVADTRLGGSCNVENLTFTPHCDGTHTECCGHISKKRYFLSDLSPGALLPATLISVSAREAGTCDEGSIPPAPPQAKLVTAAELRNALAALENPASEALIVRTLPNSSAKLTQDYDKIEPPYFSMQAMQLVRALNVRHLLVDLPSVDRMCDPDLTAHRIFWDFEQKGFAPRSAEAEKRTITELIYVPDHISDGQYVLNLQFPRFRSDAAPSSPLLYALVEV